MIYAYSTELSHSRTKGSKNGVRRYQNEDGTGTPLGLKLRREAYASDKKESKPELSQEEKKAYISKHATDVAYKKALKEESGPSASKQFWEIRENVNKTEGAANFFAKKIDKKRTREQQEEVRKEAESMTDAELQKAINRMNLENTYIRNKSPEVKTGQEKVKDMYEILGGTLAIATSAISIVGWVQKIKKGG